MKPELRNACILSVIFFLYASVWIFFLKFFIASLLAILFPGQNTQIFENSALLTGLSVPVFFMFYWLSKNYIFERYRNDGIRLEWVRIIKSEEKYKTLVSRISDGFLSLDKELRYTYANEKIGEMTGKDPQELIGKYIWDVFPDAVNTKTYHAINKSLTEQTYSYNTDHYEPLNLWQENHIYPSADGLSIFIKDISQKKKAELIIEKGEKRFLALIENSEDIIVLTNKDAKIIYVSPALERITGFTFEDVQGKKVGLFMHPEDIEDSKKTFEELLNNPGVPMARTNCFLHKDGYPVYVEGTVINLLHDENVQAIVCNYRDITERKNAEAHIRESELSFRNLFQNLMHGFAYYKAVFNGETAEDYIYVSVNKAYEEMTGLKNIIGKKISEALPGLKESDPGLFERLNRVVKSGKRESFETYIEPLNMWYSVSLYSPQQGYIVSLSDNITEKKKLDAQQSLFVSIVNSSQDAIFSRNLEGYITSWNHSAEKLFGYKSEEAIGMRTEQFAPPGRKPELEQTLEKIIKGEHIENFETQHVKKNGELLFLSLTVSSIKNAEGLITGASIIARDITEQKKHEQELKKNANEKELFIKQLSQSNKDLQQFAYITSHNLRGPIASLMGLSNLLDNFEIENQGLEQILNGIKKATFRFDETIKDLNTILTIRDTSSIYCENLLFSDSFKKTLEQCDNLIKECQAKILYDFKSSPVVYFNKSYLESIFLNLITNSLKYKDYTRQLKIIVKTEDMNDCVLMTFSDNGIGMDLELHKDKIFKLYQRFHNNLEGKGLGLFLVKSQLEALGGSIDIESKLNTGTQFFIKFNKSNTL